MLHIYVAGVTSPMRRRDSCTGPMAAVDGELQDCQLDVKQYLFSSGIIDKRKGWEKKRGKRTLQ